MAPSVDEGWPWIVVRVEIYATALMLDGVLDVFLPSTFPKISIHDIQDPMLLEYVECRLVNGLDIWNISLVQSVYSTDVFFLVMQEHLRIFLRRAGATHMAWLKIASP